MGRPFLVFLDDSSTPFYACRACHTHLAKSDAVFSKAFQGRLGPAYLFDRVCNVEVGPSEERDLSTGLHVVADISCARCHAVVGWKYLFATEASQKYKEHRFILEKRSVTKERSVLDDSS
ncbi:hypothetical protein GGF32_002189 [Allomyces javanicus]|nr:hypothetical protein GGF32_002189 [Allomyces javanicus]KAJ3364915.1 hypothetical protein GGF31_008853 [Allomyces arbusculus]